MAVLRLTEEVNNMAGQYDLQQNFPIAGVADLIANRGVKENQMQQQQYQNLVQGLGLFQNGVQSLVDRRNQMAQALAGAKLFSQTPEGQQIMGTNQVTSTAAGGPVQHGQTAAYDPKTGAVAPNTSPINLQTLATSMYGIAPKDMFEHQIQQQAGRRQQEELALKQQIEPKKLEIEGRKALAEEKSAKMQRLIQGLLANATIKNQAQERTQAGENAAFEANKETSKHWFLHPFQAIAAQNAIADAGKSETILPEIGKTIVHPSGVKITRKK